MESRDMQDIIGAIHRGDDKALAKIYDLYYGPLYYFIQRIIDNTGEAEEIAADSFMKFWKRKENFENLQNIKSFLYTTARNACFDLLRSKKNFHKHQLDYFLLQPDDENATLDEIKSEVFKKILKQAESLPPQCKRIFQLSYLDELKNTEIAEKLGITLQTVKNRKSEALKLLKLVMTKQELQLPVIISLLSTLLF